MKARIPPKRALLPPDKELIRAYVDQHQNNVTRRFLKLACAVLHTEFGFGTGRLGKFLAKLNRITDDDIIWWHVDKLLIDQLGIEFEREEED